MAQLWSRIFAQVYFTAQGGSYERFLSLCNQQGIPISHIVPIVGGVKAVIPARFYKRAACNARRCRTQLRVKKRQGVWFVLRQYRGRWGLLLGPALFCVSIVAMQQMLWSIRYDASLTAAQQADLQQVLYSMDIYEGAVLTQEKLIQAEKMILNENTEFGWVSLNFGKGRLVVEAAPAAQKPQIEGNESVDLTAKASGLILDVNVQEGFAVKQKGQTVAQGDTLVQASKQDYTGNSIQTHAKGTVIAQVKQAYQCRQPLQYTARIPTGQTETVSSVRIGSKTFLLSKESQQAQAIKNSRHHQLSVLGFVLPATIEEELVAPTVQQQITLTEEQAVQYAKMACMQQFYTQFPDANILSQSDAWEMEERELVYDITLEFTANIAY